MSKDQFPHLTQEVVDKYLGGVEAIPESISTNGVLRGIAYLEWQKVRANGQERPTINGLPGWTSSLNADEVSDMNAGMRFVQGLRGNVR